MTEESPSWLTVRRAEVDAARKPLTDEEQAVYNKTSRRWTLAEELGDEDTLDRLVEKGWLCYNWYLGVGKDCDCEEMFPQAHEGWVYQRTHSLDG